MMPVSSAPPGFEWGTPCSDGNTLCHYQEPHKHGFACDKNCPCWAIWPYPDDPLARAHQVLHSTTPPARTVQFTAVVPEGYHIEFESRDNTRQRYRLVGPWVDIPTPDWSGRDAIIGATDQDEATS